MIDLDVLVVLSIGFIAGYAARYLQKVGGDNE